MNNIIETWLFAKSFFSDHLIIWYSLNALLGMCFASCVGLISARLPSMEHYRFKLNLKEALDSEGLEVTNKDYFSNLKKPDGLWYPPSRCDHCHTPIKLWHNIPILGWLMLGGKCASCKTKIPFTVLFAEIAGAALGITIAYMVGITPWVFLWIAFAAWIAAAVWIDWNTGYLPTESLVLLMWIGFILSAFLPATSLMPNPEQSILGAASGYMIVKIISKLGYLLKGQEGFGGGDSILMATIGAFVGPVWVIHGFFIATIVAVFMMPIFIYHTKNKNKNNEGNGYEESTMPFGPALAFGVFLSILSMGVFSISPYLPIHF